MVDVIGGWRGQWETTNLKIVCVQNPHCKSIFSKTVDFIFMKFSVKVLKTIPNLPIYRACWHNL